MAPDVWDENLTASRYLQVGSPAHRSLMEFNVNSIHFFKFIHRNSDKVQVKTSYGGVVVDVRWRKVALAQNKIGQKKHISCFGFLHTGWKIFEKKKKLAIFKAGKRK